MNDHRVPGPGGHAPAPAISDEALLDRVAAGEASALNLLYERYRSMAYGLAARITGDAGLAEDVLQDAFLGVWRHASRYAANRASGRTWVLSIVHHRAIDAVRRRRPTAELTDTSQSDIGQVAPDAWEEVAGRLDRAAVAAALATLPSAQRDVLELAYFGGLTQTEIAARTGAPLGTVKSRARLALVGMRRALGGATLAEPDDADGGDAGDSRSAGSRPGAPAVGGAGSGPGADAVHRDPSASAEGSS